MKRMITEPRWLRLWIVGICMAVPCAVIAKTSLTTRYPYDPACPWGRLSNGKGMIHRCLTEAEAQSVADASANSAKPAKTETKAAAAKPTESPAKAETEDKPPSLPKDVQVALGPIVASEGEITVGRLNVPMDRYKACVMDHGGLTAKKGEVIVKFMVRAEFERAEGTSVKSSKGLSAQAARCVAEVVDRRKVGPPTAPMTSAELTFSFTE